MGVSAGAPHKAEGAYHGWTGKGGTQTSVSVGGRARGGSHISYPSASYQCTLGLHGGRSSAEGGLLTGLLAVTLVVLLSLLTGAEAQRRKTDPAKADY